MDSQGLPTTWTGSRAEGLQRPASLLGDLSSPSISASFLRDGEIGIADADSLQGRKNRGQGAIVYKGFYAPSPFLGIPAPLPSFEAHRCEPTSP